MARLYLAAPQPDEDSFHESVARTLDVLLLPPAQWTTFPAGHGQLPPATAARLYRLGLKPGWPDILIANDGLYALELKVGRNGLSQTRIVRGRGGRPRVVVGQVEMHALLRAAGVRIGVCRTLDRVLAQLREWQIPLREAAA